MIQDHIQVLICNAESITNTDEFILYITPRSTISLTTALVELVNIDVINTLVEYVYTKVNSLIDETSLADIIEVILTSHWLLMDDGTIIEGDDYVDYCTRHGSLNVGTPYILTGIGFLPLHNEVLNEQT